jgi:hypothetical protein
MKFDGKSPVKLLLLSNSLLSAAPLNPAVGKMPDSLLNATSIIVLLSAILNMAVGNVPVKPLRANRQTRILPL